MKLSNLKALKVVPFGEHKKTSSNWISIWAQTGLLKLWWNEPWT
jgi:hypothetical protein